ncbi:37S ribosomal protein S25 [Yarrowia sp. B02]|nr:37S ribosomal protein S25 [Yarrowia sp. B02]
MANRIKSAAVDIVEITSGRLSAGMLSAEPLWYRAMAANMPTTTYQHKPHFEKLARIAQKESSKLNEYIRTRSKPVRVRTRHLYEPVHLKFLEDEIREIFYAQHPWELARPKMVVENSGDDHVTQDWSKMHQANKKLDGESVVQRTIFLLGGKKEHDQEALLQAYDKARFEFYKLRMAEDVQNVTAAEEADMFGACFSTSSVERNLFHEQKRIEEWKEKAVEMTLDMGAK